MTSGAHAAGLATVPRAASRDAAGALGAGRFGGPAGMSHPAAYDPPEGSSRLGRQPSAASLFAGRTPSRCAIA